MIEDNVISTYFYGEGDNRSIAKDTIEAFKKNAISKGGFYIGRYEQGEGNVIKKNVVPYVSITRDNAKTQAEIIDKESSYVVSELISSYAWDTALNFICQTNAEGYILATTTDKIYGNMGTGRITNTGMYTADRYNNIYDMLGNICEWITEYSTYTDSNGDRTCTYRGGLFGNRPYYAANRRPLRSNYIAGDLGFRTQLYVK